MSKSGERPQVDYKRWLINILIAIAATILMVVLIELAFRWIDGYQYSTLPLHQKSNAVQPVE